MGSPELQDLEHAMGELLSVMRDPDNGPLQVAEAWSRCRVAGEVLTEVLGGTSELSEVERDELRDSLDRLLRLNAIARQSILDEQQSVTQLLNRTRETGEKLRAYATGPGSTGDSCDLAG